MAETVTMPKLGFDMAEGTLIRWIKLVGDPVVKGEVLAEIETDKATVEVESSYSGVVHKQLVEPGAVVPVGAPIAVIAAPDEKVDDAQGVIPENAPPQAPSQPAEPQITSMPGVEQTFTSPQQALPPKAGIESIPVEEEGTILDGSVHASPLARKIAHDRGVDLSKIQGSGPGGRIVRRDLEAGQAQGVTISAQTTPAAPAEKRSPLPIIPAWTPGASGLKDEFLPIGRLRSAIGRRMAESKQQAPHFYVTHSYNVGMLMDLRKQINASIPEDQKVSVNDLLVKAVARTLLQFPNLNASLEGNQVHRQGNINIGSAVSVPGGLMTIVTRNADQKPLLLISSELREMTARARSGKVHPQDIEASTFSISNLGMYAVDEFMAIINPPEAAILAVSSAMQAPVVEDGELKVGWRMKATISVDHRVSDGAEAAQFLQALAQIIANPLQLLL
ncbi:MAG: dihydrolipoamide acetyltransferase family protein [Anaerolineaceae bacterium]|nr:dihydrolipoamide acetyltransferase family protein [Anaerolineaceae bacterium]